MTVILTDIGGTHARFACEENGVLQNFYKIAAADHDHFADAIAAYCEKFGYQNKGDLYLAVAAHDDGAGTWHFSNSKQWLIRPADLLPLGWTVRIIVMDFYASARGAIILPGDKLVTVKQGIKSNRTKVILGPGTGLGLAYAVPLSDGKINIQETYGGRMIMPAVSDEQSDIIGLIRNARGPDSPVMCEDIVSGRGLPILYRAVCEQRGEKPVFENAGQILGAPDDSSVRETLRLFHEYLGIFIHLTVLTGHSFGGVYLDGGIVHRLHEKNLFDAQSIIRFFSLPDVPVVIEALNQTPIWIVNDPYVALTGLQELKKDA